MSHRLQFIAKKRVICVLKELNKTLKSTATVRLVWCIEKGTVRPTSLALQCSTQSAEWK